MADGGGGVLWDVSISDTFAYNPDLRGRMKAWRVVQAGHCDPSMGDVKERLAPLRETMVAFRGTIAAGGGAPILIAGGQELQAFNVGVGDDGASMGLAGALTRAETNTQPKGGLVQQGQSFVAVGAWVQPVQPWCVPTGASLLGSAAGMTNPRDYLPFLDNPVAPYDKKLIYSVSEAASFQLRNGPATACQFDLSPFSMWGQSSGASNARNSATIPGAFFYLSTPDVSGGTQSGKELNVQLKCERDIRIANNGANATPASVDVAIPFRIVFVGYPVCDITPAAAGISIEDARAMAAGAAKEAARQAVAEYIASQGGGQYPQEYKQGGRTYGR